MDDVDYLRPWREDTAALSLKSIHLCSRGNAKSVWSRYTGMLLKGLSTGQGNLTSRGSFRKIRKDAHHNQGYITKVVTT